MKNRWSVSLAMGLVLLLPPMVERAAATPATAMVRGGGEEESPDIRSLLVAGRMSLVERAMGHTGLDRGEPYLGSRGFRSAAEENRSGGLSPARAFLYSALVPGLGELKLGSRTGYAFLAGDVLAWTGRVIYRRRGNEKEEDYRAFADLNYQRPQYADVIEEIYREYQGGFCETPGSDTLFVCHELASYFALDANTRSQHFYEDIGKLDKYIFGWLDWGDTDGDGVTDYNPAVNVVDFGGWGGPGQPWPTGFPFPPEFTSDLRATYQDMRREANDNFGRATNFSWFLLLNRVASAFHAAYLARAAGLEATEDAGVEPPTWQLALGRGPGGGWQVAVERSF